MSGEEFDLAFGMLLLSCKGGAVSGEAVRLTAEQVPQRPPVGGGATAGHPCSPAGCMRIQLGCQMGERDIRGVSASRMGDTQQPCSLLTLLLIKSPLMSLEKSPIGFNGLYSSPKSGESLLSQ